MRSARHQLVIQVVVAQIIYEEGERHGDAEQPNARVDSALGLVQHQDGADRAEWQEAEQLEPNLGQILELGGYDEILGGT